MHIKPHHLYTSSERLGEYIPDPFHVRMNSKYVATVHYLDALIDYIESNPDDAKTQVFGEIVKGSNTATDKQYNLLTMIIAKAKGMALYNQVRHTCVELSHPSETVTILTRSGKQVTLCDNHGVIEVVYHNSGSSVSNGDQEIPSFDVIGPLLGADAFKRTKVTNVWIVGNKTIPEEVELLPASDCCGAETHETDMGVCPECNDHCEFIE